MSKCIKTNKIDFLATEFNIARSRKIESEVGIMCNLSVGVERRGLQRGIKQGIEQGIERGASAKAVEIAKNMLAENISAEMIFKVTGLRREEIFIAS